MPNLIWLDGLTGGGTALDGVPSASIATGDVAVTIVNGGVYFYRYDSTDTTAEEVPKIITPNDAGGTGAWTFQPYMTNPPKTITGNYTVQPSDETIYINASADMTVTLLAPTSASAKTIRLVRADNTSAVVTVQPVTGTVNGVSSETLDVQREGYEFIPDANSNDYLVL